MTILLIRKYCEKIVIPIKLLYLGFSAILANIICLSILNMVFGASLNIGQLVNSGFAWGETTIFWFGIPWFFISLIASLWLFWHPGVNSRSNDNYASFCALTYCGYWLVLGFSCFLAGNIEASLTMTTLVWICFVYFAGWGSFNIWLFVRYLVDVHKRSH